jgi:hypothetical protein
VFSGSRWIENLPRFVAASRVPAGRPSPNSSPVMLVEIQIQCPHCGETITTTADTSQGDYSTIEDCEVCCAPMNIEVVCEPGEVEDVRVTPA